MYLEGYGIPPNLEMALALALGSGNANDTEGEPGALRGAGAGQADVVLPLARGGADINAKDELIAGLLRAPPHVRDIQRHGRVAQALIAEQSGIKVLVKAMRAHETHAVSVQ